MSAEFKVYDIVIGGNKKISGLVVKRTDDDLFEIEGIEYSSQGAIEYLSSRSTTDFKYDNIAFVTMKPRSSKIVSSYRITSRKQHLELILHAKSKGLYLYFASTSVGDGGKVTLTSPLIVDWATIPDQEEIVKPAVVKAKTHTRDNIDIDEETTKEAVEEVVEVVEIAKETEVTGFKCKYCAKTMSSSSGLTLHIKSKHRHLAMQNNKDDDDDDVVDIIKDDIINSSTSLFCPFCNKRLNSTPGRTNHVKSKHPEKLQEYMESLRAKD